MIAQIFGFHLDAEVGMWQDLDSIFMLRGSDGRMDAPPAGEPASVVGPLCTPLDVIADRMPLPAAQIGDLVVVFQSGAYGASASPQAFLGHPQVVEILA